MHEPDRQAVPAQCDEAFGPLLAVPIAAWSRVLASATFLPLAAVASPLVPAPGRLSISKTEQIVTVALIMILFDGGDGLAKLWRRGRPGSRHQSATVPPRGMAAAGRFRIPPCTTGRSRRRRAKIPAT